MLENRSIVKFGLWPNRLKIRRRSFCSWLRSLSLYLSADSHRAGRAAGPSGEVKEVAHPGVGHAADPGGAGRRARGVRAEEVGGARS